MLIPPGTGPVTVLHIEDDPASRHAVSQALRRAGFRVREAPTGREALDAAAAEAPDLALLDAHLSDGLSGLEVCRRLKADPATAAIPVLMISAPGVSALDRARGLEGGADGYLATPVEPEEVVAHVRALLRARRAEAERDQLLRRLRLQVERMPLGCINHDADLRVTDWNPAAEAIFGYTREEVLGLVPLDLLVPPAARGQVEEVVSRIRAGDMEAHSVNENVTKDGRLIACEWFNTPLYKPDGTFDGVLSMVLDVTERLRAEEQLRQAQKMEAVGQLAGGIAHDFNNVLTVICGCGHVVLEELPADSPSRPHVAEMVKAGERAAELVRRLLAFGRKSVLAPRALDLNEVVRGLEGMLRRLLGEDIDLLTRLQPGLGRVKADPGQLEQVFLNLAANARDAMPQGGRLTVETRDAGPGPCCGLSPYGPADRPSPCVLLAVTDTGQGMTPQVQARIFEPFFTTKEKGKGTGLGLAMVHGFVRQSGGRVEVESEVGRGTTFKLYLPRAAGMTTPNETGPVPQAPPPGQETVLLVEDEATVRALGGHVLRLSGYSVLEAGDGEEALRLARIYLRPIHLLVTDVVMPGLGGRQVADRIVEVHPEARVLFVSGYTDDTVVRHGVLEEQVHFLQKPFTPAALARKVREVLDTTGEVTAAPGDAPPRE